jgi:hypothetical protein
MSPLLWFVDGHWEYLHPQLGWYPMRHFTASERTQCFVRDLWHAYWEGRGGR